MGIKGNAHPSLSAKSRCAFVQSGSRTTSKRTSKRSTRQRRGGNENDKINKRERGKKKKRRNAAGPLEGGIFPAVGDLIFVV